MVNHMLNIKIL